MEKPAATVEFVIESLQRGITLELEDGRIVTFHGEVYDKESLKRMKEKYLRECPVPD